MRIRLNIIHPSMLTVLLFFTKAHNVRVNNKGCALYALPISSLHNFSNKGA